MTKSNAHGTKVSEGEKKENKIEAIFKVKMAESFPNWQRTFKSQIQEIWWSTNRMNRNLHLGKFKKAAENKN